MDTITSEYGEPPRINVVWLREYIKNHSELSQETSETIASAINMGLKQQDTSGFATKDDIKDGIKDLKIFILESQNKLIKWVAGLLVMQTGIVIALKLFG